MCNEESGSRIRHTGEYKRLGEQQRCARSSRCEPLFIETNSIHARLRNASSVTVSSLEGDAEHSDERSLNFGDASIFGSSTSGRFKDAVVSRFSKWLNLVWEKGGSREWQPQANLKP
jgi:hypothetical protein